MIPFARICKYGNIIPTVGTIKRFKVMFSTMYLLNTNGELYVIGSNANGVGGGPQATTLYSRWTLIATDVDDIWCNVHTSALLLMKDGSWKYTGRSYLIGTSSVSYGFIDCSSSMGTDVKNNLSTLYLSDTSLFYIDPLLDLYAMGLNSSGQLGTGNTTALTSFTKINSNVLKVACAYDGSGSLIIKNDNTVYGTGSNLSYQLGFTSPTSTNVWTVSTAYSGSIDVQMGYDCSYALKADGLYTAGKQFSGQMGNGQNNNNSKTPGKMTVPGTPVAFKANNYSCIVYSTNGSYYMFGQDGITSTSGSSNSQPVLISDALLKNVINNISEVQIGYYAVYSFTNNNIYGSGSATPINNKMLPYYTTTRVIGLQPLETSL